MLTLVGVGTPRGAQSRLAVLGAVLSTVWTFIYDVMASYWAQYLNSRRSSRSAEGSILAESFA